MLTLAARPCRHFDDGHVRVSQRTEQVDTWVARRDRRSPSADQRIGIRQRHHQVPVVRLPEPLERAEGRRPHPGIGRPESGPGRGGVALVPGQGNAAPGRFDLPQSFSRFVIVVTITAMAKPLNVAMTAPTRRASPPLESRAISRCSGFGGW